MMAYMNKEIAGKDPGHRGKPGSGAGAGKPSGIKVKPPVMFRK
jgi:hypothetical protein